MTGKLDKSLDDILKGARSQTKGRATRRGPRGTAKTNGTVTAPVGGVKKTTKAVKPVGSRAVPTGPHRSVESKIIVSNLPPDVTEAMMKEYFGKTISPVKKVLMSYGPDGKSRGICTVIFRDSHAAAQAAEEMNGVKVDQSPMKVELVLGPHDAPAIPQAKNLKDRITKPKPTKAQPKPANAAKPATGKAGKAKRGGPRGKPKKTQEELDADMADYFVGGAGDTTVPNGGSAQPATNGGDVGMVDDIQ
ncbi:hypothetical protein EJ05DRAFT_496656 [Pseudovirgaria hyperparasitica]|uniref:RRM domain-containing protein n=1 Tax=Pseudovirgaria hyperparasitica TaxID=470096 RepID=A0A6A6WJ45_9PEZI|nr:uncharacterized protein EJ05DRAFT_496656 [Pseudovirgaria hyperparasitica]KAF2761757.1 hypothetical protein EJ05DRAFT_496656 [Pseudovirgaria hyperparasitica]